MSRHETERSAGSPPPAAHPLSVRLAGCGSVRAACEATVDYICSDPRLMPSIYMHRGGRLRCMAVRRYRQAFDGMLPGSGVIGTTFVKGTTTVVDDARTSDHYLAAAAGVLSEICAPIRLGGVVVGALNVEAEDRFDERQVTAVELIASVLSERIGELGGLPPESRAQRLARHSAALAGLVEEDDVRAAVIDAAIDVSDMESAALLRASGRATQLVAAGGPHAAALRSLEAPILDQLASWAFAAPSTFTVGGPEAAGFAGHEALREAGAEAVITLSLSAGGSPGALIVLDSGRCALDTDDIEMLELLVAQASSSLSTSAAVNELRDRAGRDALTQLGHHATFHEALVAACAERRDRGRLTLLVADIDGFKQVNDEQGHQAGDMLLVAIADALSGAIRDDDLLCRIGGDEFAALIWADDPDAAVACGRRLLGAVERLDGPTVSVGLALHQPGQSAGAFFARADQAMFDVKRAGGADLGIG